MYTTVAISDNESAPSALIWNRVRFFFDKYSQTWDPPPRLTLEGSINFRSTVDVDDVSHLKQESKR